MVSSYLFLFFFTFSVVFFCFCFASGPLMKPFKRLLPWNSPAPRNAASMPARFDVCGGLARYLFSDLDLNTLKAIDSRSDIQVRC